MQIDKAIENFEKELEDTCFCSVEEWRNTMKLGTEALKLVVKRRRFAIPDKVDLLPGETE